MQSGALGKIKVSNKIHVDRRLDKIEKSKSIEQSETWFSLT